MILLAYSQIKSIQIIHINEQVLEKKFYKTRFVKRAEGRDLIVWIDLSTQKPISIAFKYSMDDLI